MGVYRPMLVFLQITAREHKLPRREHRLDEPHPSIPQHGCIPAEPASVSSDASIVIAETDSEFGGPTDQHVRRRDRADGARIFRKKVTFPSGKLGSSSE